jgi:hypothetical protein
MKEDDVEPDEEPLTQDAIDAALAQVRADLEDRRARGELPQLPPDELDRQFTAVVEAVEAGIVEAPPLDPGDLTGPAVLETWRPMGGRSGPLARIVGAVLSPITRVVGVMVRRQVAPFTQRTAAVVEELAARQNKLQLFLSRAFLDRQRRLEYRVAELERDVAHLRLERDALRDDLAARDLLHGPGPAAEVERRAASDSVG